MNVNYDRIKAQLRKTARKTAEMAERFKDEAESLIDSVGRMGVEMMKTEYESFEELDMPQEAQQDEKTQEVWLRAYGESNEEWIMYLETRMNKLLLEALGEMLTALAQHAGSLFSEAESRLRVGIADCMKKREKLCQDLIKEFGPNALSLADVDPIPLNLTLKSPYEPLYEQMKAITRCPSGQQTADALKARKKDLADALGKLPASWRADVLARYPGFGLLNKKEE